jgi:cytochrome oxidase Cu insertion factor (SCO1/SenC/PrrC family)
MEDRLTPPRGRPGAAFLALAVIGLITAAWWALALWPAGDVVPEWLARTRAACFGAVRGGLPNAGGWILLIGEPIGMLGVLVAVWGPALGEDLRRIRADRRWRRITLAAGGLALVGLVILAQRVAFTLGVGRAAPAVERGVATVADAEAPDFVLTDQHGNQVSLADFRGRPVLVTFAFGHCTTVCPSIVRDLLAARAAAGRREVSIVVVSLDPWRDTPERLPSLATRWRLGDEDRVLSGGMEEVRRVLDGWGIGRRRDETTGDIDHQGTVIGVNPDGRIAWRLDGGWGRVGELLATLAPLGGGARRSSP